MAQKNTKGFNSNSLRDKNANFMVVKSRNVDQCKEINSPKNEDSEREKRARAAAARLAEDEKKKRERKEEALRQKEEAKLAEEEKIETMKRKAAEKAEALERKEAVKAEHAKACAAAAADKRAAKGTPVGHNQQLSQGTPLKHDTQESKNVFAHSKTQLSQERAKEDGDCVLYNKVKRSKEAVAKEEELAARYKLGKKTEGAIDNKEAIKASETQAVVAADAIHTILRSSQTKFQEKEIIDAQPSGIIEQKIRSNIMPSYPNEKEPVNITEKEKYLQKNIDFIEEAPYASQNGARPKGKISEQSVHGVNTQYGKDSNHLYRNRSIITIKEEERTSHKEEKIVSVTGNKALQSGDNEGQKEIVSVTGIEGYIKKESEESSRYLGRKLDTLPIELKKSNMKSLEGKENKQDDIPDYQNESPPGNKNSPNPSQQREHKHIGQQSYIPPAQRNEGCWYRKRQLHHREHGNNNQNHHKGRERHQSSPPYVSHSHTQQSSQFYPPSRALICGSCSGKFNFDRRLPRNLHCGHSLCSHCISEQIYHSHNVVCPQCQKYTWYVKRTDDCPVNQPLLKILSEESNQDDIIKRKEGKGVHFPKGNDARQYQSQPGNNMARSGIEQVGNKSLPPRSPHGSKCLEIGVRPSSYCCTCKVWVCARCAEAEHSTRKCSLKSLTDQLLIMKQENELQGKRAQQLLSKSVQTLEKSFDEDKIFLLWMRAAFECIEKKQNCMEKKLEEGRELMKKLTDAMESESVAKNLPEALAEFQGVDDIAKAAQQWESGAGIQAGNENSTVCLKHLMRRTLESLHVENGKSGMFVVDKLPGPELWSELMVDGGRFHLHALTKSHPAQALRALPLECIKSTQAAGSTLTFLDLSWGGVDRGRLYIRLTGDTLRGRQFISLCIGEGGNSFRGTCFHRVWWKGLPGEHLWSGDYEKNDGSGGRALLSPNNSKEVPAGREISISAGLVAGCYEKENIRSVFRIYTREEKDGKDEAGFGQVEFGLDVVKEAVKQRNIRDVMISNCGLVLEM